MNRARVIDRLVNAGLNAPAAERKADLFHRASLVLKAWAGMKLSNQSLCFVPGRIEVLGKHTDYAGGRSLLCAIERGFCVVAAPRTDQVIRVADAIRNEECQFALCPDLETTSIFNDWSVYPRTVARRIARNFPGKLRGVDMAFASDLPSSAGLSSSSALVVSTFLVLSHCNELELHPAYQSHVKSIEDLATYLGCVENGQPFGFLAGDMGVGTFGGSEDHTAILYCRAGWLSQFRFRPVRLERNVALPADSIFVIGVSGVVADKTGSAREKYNESSQAARTILEISRAATGRRDATLLEAATHAPDAAERIRRLLSQSQSSFPRQTLLARFEQFLEESIHNVPEAVNALARNDLEQFGRLVDRSQAAAERALGNQISETQVLAHSARELGAIAASSFGAGFGGSVWAMVTVDRVEDFVRDWKDYYCRKFPARERDCDFFVCSSGPGATVLS